MKSREKIRIECACGGGMEVDASPAWVARRVEEIFWQCHISPQCGLTKRALDGACESCKLELTPSCPIRTGNGCDLYQPRQ